MTHGKPTTACKPLQTIEPSIFRAYDIRGIAERELDCQSIERIGQSLASLALEAGETTLLFGSDARLSSPVLREPLLRGVLSTGMNVVDLGTIPTPLMYFAAHTTGWQSGMMLTASHNPATYNGIKIIRQRTCLTPDQIQQIRIRAQTGDFCQGTGSRQTLDIIPAYLTRLTRDIHLKRPFTVVIDCANAVTGLIAPRLFELLGCQVIPLFCELDGHFPHHPPDPTVAENLDALISEVISRRADLGIAFDGDGDRVVMVTDQGHIIDTDRLLMLFVRHILPAYHAPKVVFDVKCSTLLGPLITSHGGTPIMSRSGHSFMKKSMQESGAVIGAEFSAHVFIKDRWYGFDDGLYTAARFLALLSEHTGTAQSLLESLPASIVTPELRLEVGDDRKFDVMERITQLAHFPDGVISRLDGLRVDFEEGWGLIRASNTTPALLLRFEAKSLEALQQIQARFRSLLIQADGTLTLSF